MFRDFTVYILSTEHSKSEHITCHTCQLLQTGDWDNSPNLYVGMNRYDDCLVQACDECTFGCLAPPCDIGTVPAKSGWLADMPSIPHRTELHDTLLWSHDAVCTAVGANMAVSRYDYGDTVDVNHRCMYDVHVCIYRWNPDTCNLNPKMPVKNF
eukprot:scpid104336/ scgid27011/ 